MPSIENVTGTAFVVAEFRAEENSAPSPLYRDSVVGLFLTDESRQAAARVAAGFPLVKEMVRIRTKYFDDALEREIRAGCRQVVILGAGLDTRAVRKRSPGVTFFEIDDATTLLVKRARYEHEHFDINLRFIPGNYVTDGLSRLLKTNGFDFDQPAFFIWEGNTMYLPMEAVRRTLTELRDRVRRFRIAFDYMAESVITKTTGDPRVTRLVENFENMGAPWLTGITDVWSFARELGLDPLESFCVTELYRAYNVPRSTSSTISELYSVCTLAYQADPVA